MRAEDSEAIFERFMGRTAHAGTPMRPPSGLAVTIHQWTGHVILGDELAKAAINAQRNEQDRTKNA